MDLFAIKLIALISMTVDHIGVFFLPNDQALRIVGRISFPLFAWAIANGSVYTKNIYKYLLRIFILALISQIPYRVLFIISGNSNPGLNILFTLSLGLLGIILFKKSNSVFFRVFFTAVLLCISVLFNVDYGVFGVLSVLLFYIFYNNFRKMVIFFIIILFLFEISPIFLNILFPGDFRWTIMNILELFSALSLFVIHSYNRKVGLSMKYFFYTFYPFHLLVLLYFKLAG